MTTPREKDYVLGTGDEETERLGLQHRVWQARAKAAWQRAGFGAGQIILDVGCGPGYASLDLATIVGPSGRVVALERSRHFLDVLGVRAKHAGVSNITTHEIDLDEGPWPTVSADGVWCRWVFAFVKQPRVMLERIIERVKPGGSIVFHEYFDYGTWRLTPRCAELEEFVQHIMRGWRKSGGEPDIGLELPRWLNELGWETELTTLVDVVPTGSEIWQWPAAFVHSGLERLVQLGEITAERSQVIWKAFKAAEAKPETRMVTPALLQIIAERR